MGDDIKKSLYILTLLLTPHASLGSLTPVHKNIKAPPHKKIQKQELKKKINKIISKNWTEVQINNQTAWIRSNFLLSAFHLSEHVYAPLETPLREKKDLNIQPRDAAPPNQRLKLLDLSDGWAQVDWQGKPYWIELKHLKPWPHEWGYVVTRKKTKSWSSPKWDSDTFSEIKKGIKIKPAFITDQWVAFKWEDQLRYIPLIHLISKLDLASEVIDSNKRTWRQIHFIIGQWAQTPKKDFIEIKNITGFRKFTQARFTLASVKLRTKPHLDAPLVKKIPALTPLIISKQQNFYWAQSIINKEKVWWQWTDEKIKRASAKKHDLPITLPIKIQPIVENPIKFSPPQKKPTPVVQVKKALKKTFIHDFSNTNNISTSDFFKNPVFDIVTSITQPETMLASSNGIFITNDGQNWKRIEQFKNQNHPLESSPDGTLYVGPYKSTDNGQSFKPFIRWERVLSVINSKKPKSIKVTDIKVNDSSGKKISITLSIGKKKNIQVKSFDKGITWTL